MIINCQHWQLDYFSLFVLFNTIILVNCSERLPGLLTAVLGASVDPLESSLALGSRCRLEAPSPLGDSVGLEEGLYLLLLTRRRLGDYVFRGLLLLGDILL